MQKYTNLNALKNMRLRHILCEHYHNYTNYSINWDCNQFNFNFREPYYRYDPAAAAAAAAAAAPRAMGPPGGYPPRHRAPHPLQQQTQYPSYQPTAENIYGLGPVDQHAAMGMSDLGGWGAATSVAGQAGAYPGAGLGAYGHPQAAPPPQQRQTPAQSR